MDWRWVLRDEGFWVEIWVRREEKLWWKVVKAWWRLNWGCLGGGKVVGLFWGLFKFIFVFLNLRLRELGLRGFGFKV